MARYGGGYERRVAYHYDFDLIDRNFGARAAGYGPGSRGRAPAARYGAPPGRTPQGYAYDREMARRTPRYDRLYAGGGEPRYRRAPGPRPPYDPPFRPRTSSYWRSDRAW